MIQFRMDARLLKNHCCGSSILLPRQSPLGISVGQHYRPTGIWPATFVCIQHERSFVGSVADICRSDIEIPDPGSHQPKVLWEVECKCDHEGCARSTSIFVLCLADTPGVDIALGVLHANPIIACTSEITTLE